MAVAYATTNSTIGSFSQNPNVALPSGSAAGDTILLESGHETARSISSFSGITGWTEVPAGAANITGWRQRIYTKVLTAGDVTAGSVTVNFDAAGGYSDMILHRATGADATTPIPSGGSSVATGTSSAPSGSSCTVDQAGSVVFRFEVNASGTARSGGPPTGMTATTGSPIDSNLWGDYQSVSPSSTGAKTSALTGSDNWAVHMVVIQPAAGGGGTNTPMTISTTQTQTPSRGRAVSPSAKSATQNQAATRARAVGIPRSATQTQTTGSAPVLSGLGVDTTQTQTPTRIRSVAAPRSATSTQIPTRARQLGLGRSATDTQTTSVTKGQGFLKTLSGTVSQTAARVLDLGVRRAGIDTQTPAMARAVAPAPKAVSTTQTPSRERDVAPATKSATETQTPTAAKGQGYFRAFSGTVTQTASRMLGVARTSSATSTAAPVLGARSVARAISATVTQTLTRGRTLACTLAATQTQTGSSDQQQSGSGSNFMTLTAVVTQTATRASALARALAGSVAQTPSGARAVSPQPRIATQTQVPTMTKGAGYFINATRTVTQAPLLSKAVGIVRAAAASQTPTVRRAIARQLTHVTTQVATLARGFWYGFTATQTQAPTAEQANGPPIYYPAVDTRRSTLRYHPRKGKLMATSGTVLFAAFDIVRGKRIDFDVDARAWLTGTARLASDGFVIEQAAGDPVVYEAPLIYDGRDVKLWATVAEDATPGAYRVEVDIADDQGRTTRQAFQMRVV